MLKCRLVKGQSIDLRKESREMSRDPRSAPLYILPLSGDITLEKSIYVKRIQRSWRDYPPEEHGIHSEIWNPEV